MDRILKTLEFHKIQDMLCALAVSQMGKQLAVTLLPSTDLDQVKALLEQTSEAESLLIRRGNPLDTFTDVRASLKKSAVMASLGMKELLDIAKCMSVSRRCRESILKEESKGHITRMAQALHTCRGVEDEIFRCILSEEEMADNASPKLADIRRQMRAMGDKVRDKLNAIINSSHYKTYLQEALITIRAGRYVVPVKQEYRAQVPGLLHDQSGSGATLFIEPMAVVELGNELKRLQGEERDEIERILSALTALVSPESEPLSNSLDTLAALDLIFAKAGLARQMQACEPKLNGDGYIRIVAGRHPLIAGESVVPIDIWLGKDYKTLIITGPNTGGKTVTLKTVGLFTLMAQAGLFLPAHTGTEVSVFGQIFADIGDEQSIEQSLSTFSSHMTNIVSVLGSAADDSLILLDELGSGTDPIEGAALAQAILEDLHARRCTTLATTHYSELKAFALIRDGMENASMEFDMQSLRPTYRIFVGIPGKSNAFEISRRLGLMDRIIEKAASFVNYKDERFEDVISSAESQKRIAQEERKLAEGARAELAKLRDEAEKERKKMQELREKHLNKAQDDARAVVRKAKDETEKIINELKKVAFENPDVMRAIQQQRQEFKAVQENMRPAAAEEPEHRREPIKSVQIGQTVYVKTIDQDATVLSQPNAKGDVALRAGILKIYAQMGQLFESEGHGGGEQRKKYDVKIDAVKSVSNELDVRGETVEEAILEADRFLDTAYSAGLKEVCVIHGKGTGALRAGLHAYLKKHPRVKEFRLGRYGEGEDGVTITTLK